jgi:hypothetical protein
MSDTVDSQPRPIGRASVEQDSEMDDHSEISEWSKKMRTTWPQVDATFLERCEWYWDSDWVSKVASHHTQKNDGNNGDFSWVPDVLMDIFSAELSPPRMLAILRYFLAFVAELIIVDSESDPDEAWTIHKFLRFAIEPAMVGPASDPPFLGVLKPSPDAEPVEARLLHTIGLSVYHYLHFFF